MSGKAKAAIFFSVFVTFSVALVAREVYRVSHPTGGPAPAVVPDVPSTATQP